jgi:2-Cys peroxiredoxin 5
MKLSTLFLAGGLTTASAFAPPAFVPRSHTALNVAVGDSIPDVSVDKEFPPDKINLTEYSKDKSLLIIGLPGAFTPTWSSQQVPAYLENQDALKEAGIDEVMVWCVNDGAVMSAWSDDQGVRGSMVKFYGDPSGALTKALDIELTADGPRSVGIIGRCKRHALYVVDGVVKAFNLSEAEDDPAGDDDPSSTMPDAMLAAIKSA